VAPVAMGLLSGAVRAVGNRLPVSGTAIYGTEAITLTFPDGSGTVEIQAQYDGIPAATPGLYTLHEVGTFANGTGKWANASGQVTVTGPFVLPHSDIAPGSPPWIAEIHGTISGVE